MSGDQPSVQKPACPDPEAVGTRWGDPVSAECQAGLQAILGAWSAAGADHGARRGRLVKCNSPARMCRR
jgi:hypothetical protein